MNTTSRTKIWVAYLALAALLTGQLLAAGALLRPEPAKANIFGLAGLGATVPTSDVPTICERIAIAAARQVAMRTVDAFLSRFVNKMTEKYKIRNFLYYDQVLTNYYLNNYIADKITDPDLRRIYNLMEAAYVTGAPTGTANQPDPRAAMIPRLKKSISDYYIKQGGIDPSYVYNPPAKVNGLDYFSAAQVYWANPVSFTERNLRGNFGEFQSAATTAAQLEIIVGNGLKAGRFVGGTCEGARQTSQPGDTATVADNPQTCAQLGGTWKASVLDQTRSFIDNPTRFIDNYLMGAIQRQMDNKFNPNDFWATIGSLLGNFLFNQFTNSGSSRVLPDSPIQYVPTGQGDQSVLYGGVDIDGDGIDDGYDWDNDGQLDVCSYGGTAPNCNGSQTAFDIGSGGTGICAGSMLSPDYAGDLAAAIQEVNATNPNGIADALNTEANSRAYLAEVAAVLQGRGFNANTDVLNGNGNANTGDLIAVWLTGDALAERYDAVIDAGVGNQPMRDAATANNYVGDVDIANCIP